MLVMNERVTYPSRPAAALLPIMGVILVAFLVKWFRELKALRAAG